MSATRVIQTHQRDSDLEGDQNLTVFFLSRRLRNLKAKAYFDSVDNVSRPDDLLVSHRESLDEIRLLLLPKQITKGKR